MSDHGARGREETHCNPRRADDDAHPSFRPGDGDRDTECGRYEVCLDAFVHSIKGEKATGHCPASCPHRIARHRGADLLAASVSREPWAFSEDSEETFPVSRATTGRYSRRPGPTVIRAKHRGSRTSVLVCRVCRQCGCSRPVSFFSRRLLRCNACVPSKERSPQCLPSTQ